MSTLPHDDIIDRGIAREVDALQLHGVETFESCRGGAGHGAMKESLPVDCLRRVWPVPRIQIFTLAELFAGKRPSIPNISPAMFKSAPEETMQPRLDL